MRIVLVQPPIADFYDTDIRLQPIGLGYLKAAVQAWRPDVDVIIRDYHSDYGRRTVPLPKELAYLRDYYVFLDQTGSGGQSKISAGPVAAGASGSRDNHLPERA